MTDLAGTVPLLLRIFLLCAFGCELLTGAEAGNKAWTILETGTHEKSAEKRLQAVVALGVISANQRAAKMAENALDDSNSDVRRAAVTALGDMGSKASAPKLKALLKSADAKTVVVIAAVLKKFNDPEAYEVYYEILTGQRKAGSGILGGIKDKKSLEQMGFEEAFGFLPFSGIGMGAYNYFKQNGSSGVNVNVAAATALAHDRDPAAEKALVQASFGGKGPVQAAALRALAQRGDAAVIPEIEPAMYSDKLAIRYTAAAVVVRLSSIRSKHGSRSRAGNAEAFVAAQRGTKRRS